MKIDAHTHKYKEYPDSEVLQFVNVRNRTEFNELKGKPYVKLTYGLHPWWINEDNIDWGLLRDVDVVGEIGLDKAINIPLEKQIEIFEAQLKYALSSGKDIIIHCVRAYNEVQLCLKRTGFNGKALFHAYRSTPEMARQLLKICDARFSFGNRELALEKYRKVKDSLPPERVFWESDDE